MQEIRDENGEADASAEAATDLPPGRQALLAIAVGSAVFAIVILLMLAAVLRSPAADIVEPEPRTEDLSPEAYGRYLTVDDCVAQARINAIGASELMISGHVKNTGAMTVERADLRCHFPTHFGGETSMDLPLVVNTRIDDVGDGPLKPFSVRDFRVRIGEFPDELAPEILQVEVVNVQLRSP